MVSFNHLPIVFYRIVHHAVAASLPKIPQSGCSLLGGQPYLAGFDSVAAAVLEHPVHRTIGKLPPSCIVVSYTFPATAIYIFEQRLRYNNLRLADDVQRSIGVFLADRELLVARIPSATWRGVHHLLLNPRHPLFPQVSLSAATVLPYPDK